MTYTPTPVGPFVEVPYHLATCWTSGGFAWDDLVASDGMPPPVVARLTGPNVAYCRKVVHVWPSIEAYTAAMNSDECPVGRAWLVPGADLPIRYLTGRATAPMVVGPRRNWRW